MIQTHYDVIVIGAGAGGMAAAVSACEHGASRVLLVERNAYLGGILNQCIHDGFGLVVFEESLTGPEYATRYIDLLGGTNVDVLLNCMVTKITPNKEVTCVSRNGIEVYSAKAVILTTGCRERTRGMLSLPGTRPSGIFTAGVAQRLINVQNIRPGNRAVVLGSGDVGMIMARRMRLEGMEVVCVLEKLPALSGLLRNKKQCLDDYDIPLHLCRTVVDIVGDKRLECVVAADVDVEGRVICGSEFSIDCDTLVLSVGLIPENELARACGLRMDESLGSPFVSESLESSVSGIFCAGNSLRVHELVDHVSIEGEKAGAHAAQYLIRNS
jgi:NADPH-dependent 2,4-dienoyl-CoA reductase/sulfur reductase-like enzyme